MEIEEVIGSLEQQKKWLEQEVNDLQEEIASKKIEYNNLCSQISLKENLIKQLDGQLSKL